MVHSRFVSPGTGRIFALPVALVIPLVLLPVACSSEDPTSPGSRTTAAVPASAQAVPFEVLEEATAPVSGIRDARRLVITGPVAWDELWTEMHATLRPVPPAPPVDLSSRMIIAATLGERSSGGYGISVSEVARVGDTLYAVVEETVPGPRCVMPTVVTSPAVAVSVPRTDGDVVFVERSRTVSCDGGP